MFSTFRGGVHPPHRKKYTEHIPIKRASDPKVAYIPLQQHIGAACTPIVNVGDTVKVGQKIGQPQGFVSAPVHSSISGKVKAIKEHPTPGGNTLCIIIENDFKNEIHESVKSKGDIQTLTKEEILEIIKEGGIVGMGGAGFPTHVKLSPPKEKKIDTVILNGAECEPYLTADHRIMLENSEDIVYGLKAIMKVLDVNKGYIGIEDNKMDAIEAMKKAVKDEKNIEVVPLKTKYPQGAEKQLIYACIKKEVPSGGLPMDVGVVVNNVGTAAQIAKTIKTGMPLIERVTTVTGSCIKNPQNLIIKIGTLFKDIIDECGGFKEEVGKVIMGGPMMGLAQYTLDVPVIKGASGILCLNKKEATIPKSKSCIRCGKCVYICPANLQPLYISAHSLKYNFDKSEEYKALDCIECGSCSFICPSKRPLLQSIRVAKREIIAKKRKQSK
ncbi:electron transport complex protein RnfC [Alkalithermobacter thermoalcaliphilus JW-YL-7 = DSM 7308]|uniref:Ion-translocating oxidoreductase complex subunit C n=2 Tax=Clostridium paradoxum TaxID=29346 RepID=A0A150FRE0_CLOPD|nr:Electron transport complex protein rnfC [[Clostridium] paradoxum JW-YL-7 = DSM 7308]SHK44093.1 electron transport complex protein RnfC [[Clostridium] paradoxum JW-YL-7 = DSM 7308]